MIVHVLLYEPGTDNEGLHTLELSGKTVVLMFENKDDAERYCVLLEAQDFPCPSIENIDSEEIEIFCDKAGYEYKLVKKDFIPNTEEERLYLVPPQQNMDVSTWNEKEDNSNNEQNISDNQLEQIKRRLEGLI